MLPNRKFTGLFNFICIFLFLSSCGHNPVTGKREIQILPATTEVNLGRENFQAMQQAQGGHYLADPQLNQYIQQVGMRLAQESDRPTLPYEFVIINNSIPNAWALPGGKIAIYRGLLLELKNEAELAAVLSHEIVHAAARHSVKQMERGLLLQSALIGVESFLKGSQYDHLILTSSQLGMALISQKYSRESEKEADQWGIKYMVKAGYNPYASVSLQETFLKLSKNRGQHKWLEGLFASHPPSKERISNNQKTASLYPNVGRLGAQKYQQMTTRLKHAQAAYKKHDAALIALEKGLNEEALKLLLAAISIEPREAQFHGLLSQVYHNLGESEKSQQSLTQALALNANHYQFLLQQAQIDLKARKNKAARIHLEKSLTLLPTVEAHLELGKLDAQKQHTKQALYHFSVAASHQSDSPQVLEARLWLAKLELPRNPEKYIDIQFSQTSQNYLKLYIQNKSPVKVQDIKIKVEAYNTRHQFGFSKNLSIPGILLPRQESKVKTIIQLPPEADLKRDVNISIQHLRVGP